MNRNTLELLILVVIVGCGGSSSGGGGGGSGGSTSGGSSSGGTSYGGTSYGGTLSGGGSSATGGGCPCGGCGGPPMCCGPDGSVGYGSSCDHSCPPGWTSGYGFCPGQCSNNSNCAIDEFCHSSSACDQTYLAGTCVKRPVSCPPSDGGAPVCGCDGVQYASECAANAAGEDVNPTGSC